MEKIEKLGYSQIQAQEFFTVKKEEIWGLKSIEGQFYNKTTKNVVLCFHVVAEKDGIENKIYTRRFKVKCLDIVDVNLSKGKNGYIGLLADCSEEDYKIKFNFSLEDSSKDVSEIEDLDDNEDFSLDVVANFERIHPNMDEKIHIIRGTTLSAPMQVSPSSNGDSSRSNDRFQRDIYFIPDPEAKWFDNPDDVPTGWHKCHDGSYHPCPKSMRILSGEEGHQGGLEILSGGNAKVVDEKISEIPMANEVGGDDVKIDPDTKVQRVEGFEGGKRAKDEELKWSKNEGGDKFVENKVGGKNQPERVTCQGCGVKSINEKSLPICKKDCPFMWINDVFASSWHKCVDGKYRYCETCVDLVMKANPKLAKSCGWL